MSLFIDALNCKPTSRPPVWLMRQAGRYMEAYRTLRKERSLLELFHTPEMIETITCQPVEAFGVDAAILFSDILTVFDGLGVSYDFVEGTGPVVLDATIRPKNQAYTHIESSIGALKKRLEVPLIGFVGGPFTVMSYLVEGKTSHEFLKIKSLLYQEQEQFETLLEILTQETLHYLQLQIEAGVDAIQVFDSWAHVLDFPAFEKYILGPMERLVDLCKKRNVPIILFCRGSSYFAPYLATLEPNAISLDWNTNLAEMRQTIPSSIALQGNFDPFLLFASPQVIQERVETVLHQMDQPGYIVNLGHGVHRLTPESHVKTFTQAVHSFNRATAAV
jgi:uroporphyrinogen decarboxylase